jgi:hypothetical protein
LPTHPLDLLHQSAENAKDRQHELTMASVAHANDMAQTLARADSRANAQAGNPKPERPN